MNPALAGFCAGLMLSLLGLALIWPALGRGPLALLGRATAVFLGKLALVVALVLSVHAAAGSAAATPFAVALAATVVALLIAQAGLLAWRLRRLEAARAGDPTRHSTSKEDGSSA